MSDDSRRVARCKFGEDGEYRGPLVVEVGHKGPMFVAGSCRARPPPGWCIAGALGEMFVEA